LLLTGLCITDLETSTVLPNEAVFEVQQVDEAVSEVSNVALSEASPPSKDVSDSVDESAIPADTATLVKQEIASEPEQPFEESVKNEDISSNGEPQSSIRVYTETTESAPQVDTNVEETEEVLEDGTIVKHRITTTQQLHLTSTRVVVEATEDELPKTREEAERLIGEMGVEVSLTPGDSATIEFPVSTDVQEFEETMPDGTVVKRRVITTTRQQLTEERVFVEGSDDGATGILRD
jgi:archaellum component FlaF (FlaF/FlaG flagellin family)